MWKRKKLKTKARQVVKKNYWTAIVVCFLIALLTGEFGTSILGVLQSDDSMDPNYVINNEEQILINETNEEQIKQAREQNSKIEEKKLQLNEIQEKILEIVKSNLNSATKSQKYILKVWDAVESFRINEAGLGVGLIISSIAAFAFTIVIADPLIVAGRKYFIEARKKKNIKIGVISTIFKRGNWINVAITMFLRNIYTLLWYITIIGGFIKTYEYRMIPYILAENPKIERRKAFKLSKEMMKGNKFKAFILDISFLGWSILSVLTLGLLNILYVNPYKIATSVELYIALKKQAVKENYLYIEEIEK